MDKTKNKRLVGIDVIRGVAVICVILCHVVVGEIYEFKIIDMLSISWYSRLFAFIVFTIGRLGVPFFLIMSGYLMLDRTYDEKACISFWKNKWFGLLVSVEFWIIVYHVFLCIFNGNEFSIRALLAEMLFLRTSAMSHMWYMPMILGMYLLFPILANGLQSVDTKVIMLPYIVILMSSFAMPTANIFFQTIGLKFGPVTMADGFTGGEYGLYLILGYLLKIGILKKVKTCILAVLAGISFGLGLFTQAYAYGHNVLYNMWYDNLFLLLCSAFVFELVLRAKDLPFQKFFHVIAKYSFAIYLVHNPINMFLKRYTAMITLKPLRVVLVSVATLVISLFVSVLLSKIPKIGKKILYMR